MKRKSVFSVIALSLCAFTQAQVTLGQVDNFQDGSFNFWGPGHNLQNIATGGPAGAGDRFLQIHSDGIGGPIPRLAAFNAFQWAGNYAAAGVTDIEVDMINLDDEQLDIRLVIFHDTFGGNETRFTSTASQTLAVGSGWQHLTFSLREADLTSVFGSVSYATTISSVERLMFRHQSGVPDDRGTRIAADMGMDNVAAVPEPASLIALGLGAVFLRRRKR